jgi:G3E family GTPase
MKSTDRIQLHIVGGFLGSGKTTAIAAASKLIREKGIQGGVVTNDQGKYLVDSWFIAANRIPYGQVTNGCFCCNYIQLDEQINRLRVQQGVQVIFAESVGSCTDLIATVVKPLSVYKKGETERITLSIFADAVLLFDFIQNHHSPFSKNIGYIYSKQIEEAEILVVNKTDLLKSEVLDELKILLAEKFPKKTILYQNSLDTESVGKWIETLNQSSGKAIQERKSLDIDYLVYGTGEAELAWFDQEIEIYSESADAPQIGKQIIEQILEGTTVRQWTIGHLKFILETDDCTQKISFTTNINRRDLDELRVSKASDAKLVINARIETEPEDLKQMVAGIVQTIRNENKAILLELNTSAFKPGFPNPTHRMSNVK